MDGFETADFNVPSLEVVDIYTPAPDGTASGNLVATIFYKPNGGKAHRFLLAREKVKMDDY